MAKATLKSKYIIGIVLILFSFLFFLNNFIIYSNAQINGESPPIVVNFEMSEYANIKDKLDNASSIEIPLDSSKWDVTNIELNFTNIEFKREIQEIEGNIIGHSRELDKNDKARAIQINITEPTDIFGVQIYGYESKPATTSNITVQINGYDNPTNKPNNTIYGSVVLNMSSETKWYSQTFPTHIHLTKGYYYLIVNGSEMGPSDGAKYYWGINDINPNNPNLFSWEYETDWVNGITNETFLYKLDQRITKEIFPQEINMSAEIGENTYYPILNGSSSGTGNLNLNLNFSLYNETLTIPITNNLLSDLIFNVNYSISLENSFVSEGSVIISDSNNEWNIFPQFSRFSSNYTVKFEYPESWQNLTIYRDTGPGWENITSDIIIDPLYHIIIFPNNITLEEADWKITANTPNMDFDLNLSITEWNPGQNLQFSVEPPIIQGNLTFVLVYPSEFTNVTEIREVTLGLEWFSYSIPSNYHAGTYIIKIYWNNATDAGVQSQEFQIIVPSEPFTLDPLIIFGIVLLAVGLSAFGIISYRTIKKIRTRKIEEEQKIFSKCMDIMNLDYIIVTNKRSGLSVYEQKFTSKDLNGTLISGFLQALSSFGIELMKVENQSQTIKLEYKDSIVLMSEFVNIRIILIMKESPSKYLLYSLEDLAYDTYKNYGNMIDQFNGDVRKFKGIEDLLIKHLNVSIVYPLKLVNIDKLEKIRINPSEKSVINNGISIMNKSDTEFFYIKDLILEKTCSPKDIEIILKLIEKNIFQVAI